ncbi:hypothetical protein CBR_g10853 [Chara braunii]|uniref:Uncharacterized protein n=1 Tax=Chara braunii TaxID=69332 RepID=A0A388KPG1_CHABU|nr:hypothetical protein CBR_g10853 [Chara braunii]|eukprot:GBG71917.1 hypothetical protein CBR_g10853 [Chara braunii]
MKSLESLDGRYDPRGWEKGPVVECGPQLLEKRIAIGADFAMVVVIIIMYSAVVVVTSVLLCICGYRALRYCCEGKEMLEVPVRKCIMSPPPLDRPDKRWIVCREEQVGPWKKEVVLYGVLPSSRVLQLWT